ncbi:MAG TPA: hypothetical protein VIL20_00145 [Sandaracinaceae bacterium]
MSASEADRIVLARALLTGKDEPGVRAILERAQPLPPTIGPDAAALLEDALRKGGVIALARLGGARVARTVRDGRIVRGRLWERHPPLELRYGAASLSLLAWLAGEPVLRAGPGWNYEGPLESGDALLAYVALDRLARAGSPRTGPAFARSTACVLGFADRIEAPSLEGLDAFVADGRLLEAISPHLGERWATMVDALLGLPDPRELTARGRAQARVLGAFLRAADRTGRRDLAGFLVEAAEVLRERRPDPSAWTFDLSLASSVAERSAARRAAAAFFEAIGEIARWQREAAATSFIDEEYEIAQLTLSRYERFGPDGFRWAAALAQELSSLSEATGGSP